VTIKGRVLIGLSCVFLFLFMVFLKVNINARNEYQKGEAALKNRDCIQAITHFNRAIHWYSPGSKAVKDSIHALWGIGAQSEKSGDYAPALQAFRALRSSLYSVRSFYTPHADWIERCDDRIATIIAQSKEQQVSDVEPSFSKRKEEVLKILNMQTGPNVFWSVVCEIGFVCWIGCSIGFILRVFIGKKGFNPKRAFNWGILIIFFYALWVVGMLKA